MECDTINVTCASYMHRDNSLFYSMLSLKHVKGFICSMIRSMPPTSRDAICSLVRYSAVEEDCIIGNFIKSIIHTSRIGRPMVIGRH